MTNFYIYAHEIMEFGRGMICLILVINFGTNRDKSSIESFINFRDEIDITNSFSFIMKVQNNNFTLFTLYFKLHGKDQCRAAQIYIYI